MRPKANSSGTLLPVVETPDSIRTLMQSSHRCALTEKANNFVKIHREQHTSKTLLKGLIRKVWPAVSADSRTLGCRSKKLAFFHTKVIKPTSMTTLCSSKVHSMAWKKVPYRSTGVTSCRPAINLSSAHLANNTRSRTAKIKLRVATLQTCSKSRLQRWADQLCTYLN